MRDPWDHPDARAWLDDIRERLVPAMADTQLVATVYTGGEPDVKLAVETGIAVLLDKPIVLVVQSGVKVPDKLVRVADRIVEGDVADPAQIARGIQQALESLDTEGAA